MWGAPFRHWGFHSSSVHFGPVTEPYQQPVATAPLKAVREVSVLEFTAAKDLVDHPPGTVASGLSAASAERVRARVARAGGAGTVVEETDARR